ncbi:tail fiber assembly protein, partial [Escherichia sp. 93.1462]|uniref:tail fiber assembly protein n=2 Tax=unclassified Escherichia TaxID=2608889 RepID=UPI001600C003
NDCSGKTLKLWPVFVDHYIAPLQDAVDLDMATDDETKLLLKWKKYRVLLMRVDIKNTEWPKKPESNL